MDHIHPSWHVLKSISDYNEALEASRKNPVIIFKHSVRCGISSMALDKVVSNYQDKDPLIFYLDLINHRDLSNHIAEDSGVWHQSPQVIILKDGKAIFNTSHHKIDMAILRKNV